MAKQQVIKNSRWSIEKPDWCRISGSEVLTLRRGEKEPDYRYYHHDTFLAVAEGKAPILLDGQTFEIEFGDLVAIPAGTKQQILEAVEDFRVLRVHDELSFKGAAPVKVSDEGKFNQKLWWNVDERPLRCKIAKPRTWFWLNQKPEWSRFTNIGVMKFVDNEGEMDYHYHECDEYYFCVQGTMTIKAGGAEYVMTEGDVYPIREGTEHMVLTSRGNSTLVWLYEPLRGNRYGHLHRGADD